MEKESRIEDSVIVTKDGPLDIGSISDSLLLDARSILTDKKTLSVPITEMATIGAGAAGVASVINDILVKAPLKGETLYKISNMMPGDALNIAKDGKAWGFMKTAAGGARQVKLEAVAKVPVVPVDPYSLAIVLVAVALFCIERKLKQIEEIQKQILTLLEIKDEASIEGDLETLMELLNNYKYNWNNEMYVQNSHKMALDIKRKARENMLIYQKKLASSLENKKQGAVKTVLKDLEKKFTYYRLALFTYSLASFMEVLLGGNYKEEYIGEIRDEIEELTNRYRELFAKSSELLEKLGGSVFANFLRGIGSIEEGLGKLFGSVPLLKDTTLDKILQDGGLNAKNTADSMEMKYAYKFASQRNPGTHVLIERMDDLIQIYNHTQEICFDNNELYLVSNR